MGLSTKDYPQDTKLGLENIEESITIL